MTNNIPFLIFAAVFLIIAGAYWLLVVVPERRGQSKLQRRLKSQDAKSEGLQLLRKQDVLSTIGTLNAMLTKFQGVSAPLQATLQHAGLSMTVGTFVLITTTTFFAVGIAVNMYLGVWWVALPAAVGAAFVPYFVISFMKTARIRKFEEQFPEAIDLVARALRAGHAFTTGLKMVADEMPQPIGSEFRMLYDRQNFGAQVPETLRAFGERIPSLDARFFVTAVLTQREAGGNLSEVLDRLAAVMRERFRIRREVRVRSAHGRITAFVLAAMPPTLACIMLASNPDQLKLLITDPLGIKMIIFAVVMQIIGMFIVKKLVNIEY
jgi:tight adherence protein B